MYAVSSVRLVVASYIFVHFWLSIVLNLDSIDFHVESLRVTFAGSIPKSGKLDSGSNELCDTKHRRFSMALHRSAGVACLLATFCLFIICKANDLNIMDAMYPVIYLQPPLLSRYLHGSHLLYSHFNAERR